MPWSSLATNQCVSLNNLRDAVANGVFIAISAIPASDKEITKTEALAYVDIQTSPLSSKASNQLVVKNNLNAKVYTYNRYDLNLTTCTTSNPIPVWSYLNIPYGSYKINNTYIYQIIPTTHTTFNNQITSYEAYTCTPVTRYTYTLYSLNASTCAIVNPEPWWSYNNYANGNYYVNNPYDLFSLSASTHTDYTRQITSVSVGTCSAQTKYTYIYYTWNPCGCALTYAGQFWSDESKATGYYNLLGSGGQTFDIYVVSNSHTNYTTYLKFMSTSSCVQSCKTWYFNNSNPYGFNLNETFTYIDCATGASTSLTLAPNAYASRCVKGNTIPPAGNRGDYPYTYDECCS